jgi:hypothetical protein
MNFNSRAAVAARCAQEYSPRRDGPCGLAGGFNDDAGAVSGMGGVARGSRLHFIVINGG